MPLRFILLFLFSLSPCLRVFSQTEAVIKTKSTDALTESIVVPTGKSITINSGATITNNGTATGFGSGGTWGSITGTLSSQTDLASALALKATLASPIFTGTVTMPSLGLVFPDGGGVVGMEFGGGLNKTTLKTASLSGVKTVTIPSTTGTLITTGDTGTVTDTMLAGSITASKITNTAAVLGAANTFTTNGAASTSSILISGTPYTGGSGTTTTPLVSIIPASGVTANTGWNPSGTALGLVLPDAATGCFFEARRSDVSFGRLTYTGRLLGVEVVTHGYSGSQYYTALSGATGDGGGAGRAMLIGSVATGIRMAGDWRIAWSSSAEGAGDAYSSNDVDIGRSSGSFNLKTAGVERVKVNAAGEVFLNLPTSAGTTGSLWNDGGTVKVAP